MARRNYGEGSMYFDERERLWVGRVDIGQVDGKRKRIRRKAKTKAALAAKLREVQHAKAEGVHIPDQTTTTAKWLEFWTDEILPGAVASSTEGQYRQVVKDWIVPYIGKIPLAKLQPEHVVAMMRALEVRGLSPTTQKKARTILRRALTIAERYRRVSRNVAALTDPPKGAGESKIDDALDADGVAKILETAKGDRLEALAVLVLTVGVRQGEALRLRWEDIDLRRGTVVVHGTKSTASDRKIALPAFVVASLRDHQKRQKVERMAAPVWGDPELVFTTTVGTLIHRRNALDWWHRLTVRAGVGRRRFHASRHTAATVMLNNGVPLEVVSATLGHAGLAITADVYAKVRPELQRKAADTMEALFGATAGPAS